jgi:Mrp family chromosome partitioning ATPase/capsular polysaccharide biosynthesis protein
MIWDRKWLILVLAVGGLLLALFTQPVAETRTYTATVPVEIRPLQFDQTGVSTSSSLTVPASEVQAAVSVDVAASTAQQLGMTDGGDSILANLTAEGEPGAPVINLSITGDSPVVSDELAAYASNYVDYRRKQDQTRVDQVLASVDTRIASLQSRLDELSHELDQEQANHASTQVTSTEYQAVSSLYQQHVAFRESIVLGNSLAETNYLLLSKPFSHASEPIPTGTLRLLLFPMAGLLLGVAIALTLGVVRPKILGRQQVEVLGLPILATVPKVGRPRAVRRQPLLIQRGSAWGAESISMLRAELRMHASRLGDHGDLRTVAVVSASTGEGKSTISANLASSFAASSVRTALFHADVADAAPRRRRKSVDAAAAPGGASPPMRKRSDPMGFDEIFLMPGETGWRQDVIIGSIARLETDYEVVVIDTPPLLHTADAIVLAGEADAAIVVVRQGVTLEDEMEDCVDLLQRHDVQIVGVVLNGLKMGKLTGHRKMQGYGSGRREDTPVSGDLDPYETDNQDDAARAEARWRGTPPPPP